MSPAVLLDDACVGRVMRAKKPSSTSFVFLGASLVDLAGGGPMLGRDRAADLSLAARRADSCLAVLAPCTTWPGTCPPRGPRDCLELVGLD